MSNKNVRRIDNTPVAPQKLTMEQLLAIGSDHKPCPFCRNVVYYDPLNDDVCITCQTCEAQGPQISHEWLQAHDDGEPAGGPAMEKEVWRLWDQRA